MDSWLRQSGAVGLDGLELADFPVTGRGVKTLQPFKEGETILTIPSGILWTVKHALADLLLGPALRAAQPPLSVEDTLATYLLFVRSRESGYEGPRSHVAALPESYSSSIFFEEDELEVCAGTSLYTVTKQLEESIKEDHRALIVRVLALNPDLFPLEKFTLEDVGVIYTLYMCDRCCNSTAKRFFPLALVQMGSLHRVESCYGLCAPRWEVDSTSGALCGYVKPLARGEAMSCL